MNLVVAGKIDMKSMITHHMKVHQFYEAIDLMRKQESIKVILYPEDLESGDTLD